MESIIVDGREMAREIRKRLKKEVKNITADGERPPKIVIIMIGAHPASQSYVRNKLRSCERVGIDHEFRSYSEDVTQRELMNDIREINLDPSIDGLIVQLPVPKHIDEEAITLEIDPRKDVDGFHPLNLGRMALGISAYLPATPQGILHILKKYQVETSGKHCVVLGRSAIVGTPMSILMSRKAEWGNATVTLAHSRTNNIEDVCRSADILIVAIGQAKYVKSDMIKDGAVLIDVGINRINASHKEKGYELVGDIDFDSCVSKARLITPVPGGVGQLTVTSLLENTILSRKKAIYGR